MTRQKGTARRSHPRAVTATGSRRPDTSTSSGAHAAELARTIATTDLRINIFVLKRQGASYAQIARQLGCSVGYAHGVVQEEIAKLNEELSLSRDQHRALELERVEWLIERLAAWLREGRTVKQSPDGKSTTITITRPNVGYAFAYVRALERRAKLLGLDAPQQVAVSRTDDEDGLSEAEMLQRAKTLLAEIEADQGRAQPRSNEPS
jgi:hypothetical protein